MKRLVLKSGTPIYRVKVNDILFLEKQSNYIIVHTKKNIILIRMNMNEAFRLFPKSHFVQVHKSFIVLLEAISFIESNTIDIQGKQIPVSRAYYDDLMKRFYS